MLSPAPFKSISLFSKSKSCAAEQNEFTFMHNNKMAFLYANG